MISRGYSASNWKEHAQPLARLLIEKGNFLQYNQQPTQPTHPTTRTSSRKKPQLNQEVTVYSSSTAKCLILKEKINHQ